MTSQEATGDDNIVSDKRIINKIVGEKGKNKFCKVVMHQKLSDSDRCQRLVFKEHRYNIKYKRDKHISKPCLYICQCLGLISWLVPLQGKVSSAGPPSGTRWWSFPLTAPCPGCHLALWSRPLRQGRGWRRRGTLTRRSSDWGSWRSREGSTSSGRGGSLSGQWSVSPVGFSPRAWS